MDKSGKDQDTDEEMMIEGMPMDLDEGTQIDVITTNFWNEFGDLLDDDDLT